MRKTPIVILVVAILGMAPIAHAATNIIDYQGYAWEDGGFLPSNATDVMRFVGVTDNIDAIFGINLGTEELTVFVDGLISTGQVALGGGVYAISYIGGMLDLWNDPTMNHDYGINPANATAPSTFMDGSLFLRGTFNSFVLYYDTSTGSGVYEGDVVWTAGSALSTVTGIQNNGFTFGGVLNDGAAAGTVPDGYDLQVDGVVEVDVIVAVEEQTWSGVKGLFR